MLVNVLRGSNQIGGSLIEVISEKARIILDAGSELKETEDVFVPKIEGLFSGRAGYDAVLISHYHLDHTGLLNYVVEGIPIYMTRKMFAIHKKISMRMGKALGYSPIIVDEDNQKLNGDYSFYIKDVKITPFLCDHSAFDSYMYLLETEDDSILYTGDFRGNGRKEFEELLSQLPGNVNQLIIEGTLLSRKDTGENPSELQIENKFCEIMQNSRAVFVLASTTNIDRIISVYNACKRNERIMAIDAFQADILEAADDLRCKVGLCKEIKVVQVGNPRQAHEEIKQFSGDTLPRKVLETKPFTMLIRSSNSMRLYLEGMENETFQDSVVVYSLWNGYLKDSHTKDFLDYCCGRGMSIVQLHTSGHADIHTIQRLIDRVKPHKIIPVHTEKPEELTGMLKKI